MELITQNDLLEIAEVLNNSINQKLLNKLKVNVNVNETQLKKLDEHFYILSHPDKKIDTNFKYGDKINIKLNNILFEIKKE